MPIEQVETPKVKSEEQEATKPLLNIQLPAPMNGNPDAPLPVGKHNASAQHNFQQVADVLVTIINNQKMLGRAVSSIQEKQAELETSILEVANSIKLLLNEKENKDDKPKPTNNANR